MRRLGYAASEDHAPDGPSGFAPGKRTLTARLAPVPGRASAAPVPADGPAAPAPPMADPFDFLDGGVVAAGRDAGADLARVIHAIDERLSAAEAEMGSRNEADQIAGHAHAVAVLLGEAHRLLGKDEPGPDAVALVGSLAQPIEGLYAWARRAEVDLQASELDQVFDRWDQVRHAVGLDPEQRAARYYADWEVGDTTQGALVDDCVRMFELDHTIAPLLAGEQFDTMLHEPPPPPPATHDLLESLLVSAVSIALGSIPGTLGTVVEALLAEAAGDEVDGLGRAIVGFTERASEQVVAAAQEAGGDEQGSDEPIKTEFLARTRAGVYAAMRSLGGALAAYRHLLERLPPPVIATVHRALDDVAPRIWAVARQQIIFEWINLRAAIVHGLVEGEPGTLDFSGPAAGASPFEMAARYQARQDPSDLVALELTVGTDGTATEGALTCDALEPGVKRELQAARLGFMRLPLHRLVTVQRAHDHVGFTESIATIYLPADGAMQLLSADAYFLNRLARGEPLTTTWEDGDQLDDGEERRARAAYHTTEGESITGALKLLVQITATSADLA